MHVAVFSTKSFDKEYLTAAAKDTNINWRWLSESLTSQTLHLATGCDAICAFVLDKLDAQTLHEIAQQGIQLVCLRAAGFNNLDVNAGHQLGLTMARVASYSPNAVAEHAVTLLLSLARKPCISHANLRLGDGRLDEIVGFNLQKKTIGVIGTGRIGEQFARIMRAFGCHILAHDITPNQSLIDIGIDYTDLEPLLRNSDIVSLHCPLSPETHHLLNRERLQLMKSGALLINTARGGLVETEAMIDLLKNHHLGGAGLDVIEEEESLFFSDHRADGISNQNIATLLALPSVMMTPHQAFLTKEALTNIAQETIANLLGWQNGNIPTINRL